MLLVLGRWLYRWNWGGVGSFLSYEMGFLGVQGSQVFFLGRVISVYICKMKLLEEVIFVVFIVLDVIVCDWGLVIEQMERQWERECVFDLKKEKVNKEQEDFWIKFRCGSKDCCLGCQEQFSLQVFQRIRIRRFGRVDKFVDVVDGWRVWVYGRGVVGGWGVRFELQQRS